MGEKYFNSEEYNLTEFLFIGELTLTIKKALIPAAGLGTRFLPATKSMPKEMLPIIDTPVIQYVVEEAIASGIEDIIIITGRAREQLRTTSMILRNLRCILLKNTRQIC